MFSKACEEARGYTRPTILATRLENGKIGTGVGTFIVVNSDGWLLTAAHIVEPIVKWQRDRAERHAYLTRKAAIENNANLSPGKKRHEINELTYNAEWISHATLTLGVADNVQVNVIGDPQADLALIKLPDISRLAVTNFPIFGDPAREILPGTSLCRLGFPFHQVDGVTFDAVTERFNFPAMPPFAIFPNDGIYTRDQIVVYTPPGRHVRNIETSSPGLKGQSGGPIFDSHGYIWALQSRTQSLPLGIACSVHEPGRRDVTEHQFMHVGIGPHVSHIRQFLDNNHVRYQAAEGPHM